MNSTRRILNALIICISRKSLDNGATIEESSALVVIKLCSRYHPLAKTTRKDICTVSKAFNQPQFILFNCNWFSFYQTLCFMYTIIIILKSFWNFKTCLLKQYEKNWKQELDLQRNIWKKLYFFFSIFLFFFILQSAFI